MGEEFDQTGMYAKERKARPLEAAVRLLHNEREGYKKLRYALMNDTVSQNLDPEGTLAIRVERAIDSIKTRIESRAEALSTERREFVKAEREKDYWASPSGGGGWLCPGSPTGICTYEDPEGHMDGTCDFCGFPDERK